MTEQILSHLRALYEPAVAKTTYTALQVLMEQVRIPIPDATTPFSERDIALITYGDTLRREGEAPLETLYDFLCSHLSDLVSIIHILPFSPYSSDDGFSVVDYEAVDKNLGDWDHINKIAYEFRLMVDLVLNHMSAQSAWFKAFLADNPGYADLFFIESPDTDLSSVTRPRATSLLTPFNKDSGEKVHVWTTFSADQVDFDYRAPATLLRMIGVLLFYIEQGASIIRLDAVAYLWKQVGTSSIHLQQTHKVIQLIRAILDEVAPHVLIITETNVPHQENISYFGDGYNEAQMVYNFSLPPLLLYTMKTGDVTLIANWINSLKQLSERTTFFNFTASHDGIGVRPLEGLVDNETIRELAAFVEARGGRVSYRQNTDGSLSPYELNITYVDAVASPDADETTRIKQFIVTQAVMLALSGMPAVYIHNLLGSHNDTGAVERLGYARAINRAKLDADALLDELQDENSFRAKVLETYQNLITARRNCPCFHPNVSQQAFATHDNGVLVIVRESGSQTVYAMHNFTDRPATVTLDIAGWHDLLSGDSGENGNVEVDPYGIRWLEVRN
ncbi:MAG: Beta-galactosidase C-terminal domain [Chloroflexi bacterium]|nr:Beta-galactosidase C-terminal domain [Chloroflexota bacterium]